MGQPLLSTSLESMGKPGLLFSLESLRRQEPKLRFWTAEKGRTRPTFGNKTKRGNKTSDGFRKVSSRKPNPSSILTEKPRPETWRDLPSVCWHTKKRWVKERKIMNCKGWLISNKDTQTPVPIPPYIQTHHLSGAPGSSVKSDLEDMHSGTVPRYQRRPATS